MENKTEKIQCYLWKNKTDYNGPLRSLITAPQHPPKMTFLFYHCLHYSHQHGGAPAHGLGGGNETFRPTGILSVELLHRCRPLWTQQKLHKHMFLSFYALFKKCSLTLPLSTMSLCRSLEDRTSTLMASIRSVQDAKILQGATEQHLNTPRPVLYAWVG